MKPKEWPFKADHITNDGEKIDGVKLTGAGIISNLHLQSILASICTDLGYYPTSIVEFTSKGETVHTKSSRQFFGLHPPCKKFREYTYEKYCCQSNIAHTRLFFGMESNNLQEKITKKIKSDININSCYSDSSMCPRFIVNHEIVHGYLEYDCPYLGYRELIFPIFFERKVIAVFFTGEICLEDNLEFIKQKQEDFFKNNDNCFKDYCLRNSKEYRECLEEIVEEHRKWVHNPKNIKHILNNTDYKRLIRKIDIQLNNLERTLKIQMTLQRQRYARKKIDGLVKQFHENLEKNWVLEENKYNLLWSSFNSVLDKFVNDFALRYIIVFGIKNYTKNSPKFLETVAYSSNLPSNLSLVINSLCFDLSQFDFGNKLTIDNSFKDRELLGKIKHPNEIIKLQLDPTLHLAQLLQPQPFLPQNCIALLVGYQDNNPLNSDINKPEGFLDKSLQSFYKILLSALASVQAQMAQMYLEKALRIWGHEIGQLTAGLDLLRVSYLSNVNKLRNISGDKLKDISSDLESFISSVNFQSEQSKLLISTRTLRRKNFPAFKELIFKWKDFYRLEAEIKYLQFDNLYPRTTDPKRPDIYGDKILLEQLVYNLVNNAVKYCHFGTKIHIDCKKENDEIESPHILTVTNYGIELKNENDPDKPFQLYFRGDNAVAEGLGIGLYVSKQIAEAHKGKITYFCKKISDYNVPLIEAYLRLNFQEQSDNLYKQLEKELKRLKENKEVDRYKDIVALDKTGSLRYTPMPLEIRDLINKPTYKTTFTVVIPAKENM